MPHCFGPQVKSCCNSALVNIDAGPSCLLITGVTLIHTNSVYVVFLNSGQWIIKCRSNNSCYIMEEMSHNENNKMKQSSIGFIVFVRTIIKTSCINLYIPFDTGVFIKSNPTPQHNLPSWKISKGINT